MKLSGIKYLADQGVENIWKNKMMAFATFCVLLISLLLVGIASLFYINMNRMIIGLGDKNEISVFMDVGASDEDVKKAEEAIRAISNVNTIEFKSKEDALESQK
jgi:cell division transport system permease protein